MKITLKKLKAILLYFSLNTNKLGKVKLMKLIYFLDFNHLKKYGRPITFDTYYHLEHGPIPSVIMNLVDTAAEDINASELKDTIQIEYITTRKNKMVKIVPARDFTDDDKKLFSESELEILAQVSKKFKDSTSDQIEQVSHNESPYKDTTMLQEISYSLAANDSDSEMSKEEIELLQKSL